MHGRHFGAGREKAGLPYHWPHKFRHGHALWAKKMAKDIVDLKAVSRNLMHSSLTMTDAVYGIFSESDVMTRITSLGERERDQAPRDGLMGEIEKLIIGYEKRGKLGN